MSLRRVLVPIVTTVIGLVLSATAAFAQGSSGAAPAKLPVPIRACNFQVCETVLATPPPSLTVLATATPLSTRCGHFAMSVVSPGRLATVYKSPTICSAAPRYVFSVRSLTIPPPGTTVAMQFVSVPPTLGKPVIRI